MENNTKAQTIVRLHDEEKVSFVSISRSFGISVEKVNHIYNSEKYPKTVKPKKVEPVYPSDAVCAVCGMAYSGHEAKSFVPRKE